MNIPIDRNSKILNEIFTCSDESFCFTQLYYRISAFFAKILYSNEHIAESLYNGLRERKISASSLRHYAPEQIDCLTKKISVTQSPGHDLERLMLSIFHGATGQARGCRQSITQQVALCKLYTAQHIKIAREILVPSQPDATKQKVERATAEIFSTYYSWDRREHLIKLFRKFPEKDRTDALQLYASLKEQSQQDSARLILAQMKDIQRQDRLALFQKIVPHLDVFDEYYLIMSLMHALSYIIPEKREDFIKKTAQILPKLHNDFIRLGHFRHAIRYIAEIVNEEIQKILWHCVESDIDYTLTHITSTLSGHKAEDAISIIDFINRHFPNYKKNSPEIKNALEALSQIDIEMKDMALELIDKHFLENLYLTPSKFHSLFKALKKFEPEERKAIFSLTQSWLFEFFTISREEYLIRFYTSIATIEAGKRIEFLKEYAPLFESCLNADYSNLKQTKELLETTETEQRTRLLSALTTFFQSKQIRVSIETVALLTTYVLSADAVHQQLEELTPFLTSIRQMPVLLKDIALIPPQHRIKFLKEFKENKNSVRKFINDKINESELRKYYQQSLDSFDANPQQAKCIARRILSDDHHPLYIQALQVNVLVTIPPSRRNRIAEVANELQPDRYEKPRIMKVLHSISEDEFEEIISLIKILFHDSPLLKSALKKILNFLMKIKKKKRKAFVECALVLCEKLATIDFTYNFFLPFLKYLHGIPHEKLESITKATKKYIKFFDKHDRTQIIQALLGIESNNKREIVGKCFKYLLQPGTVQVTNVQQTIEILCQIPDDMQLSAAQFVRNFADTHELTLSPVLLAQLAHFVAPIDEKTRQADMQLLVPLFKTYPNSQKLHKFFELTKLLPPVIRIKALALVDVDVNIQLDNEDPYDFIANCLENQDLVSQVDLHGYLFDALERNITNQQEALFYANNILIFIEELFLPEFHPLFQRAIQVVSIASNSSHRQNPYRLYNDLKTQLENEKLVEQSEFYSIPCRVAGETITVYVDGIREHTSKKWGYTFSDLPIDLSPDIFDTLFASLDERIAALSESKKRETEAYIEENFHTSLTSLKANILSKPLLKNFLRLKGKPDQPIEQVHYYLYCILKVLHSYDREVKKEQILSDQEAFLLSIATQLHLCSIGQRDGISLIYNNLISRNELSSQVASEDDFEIQLKGRLHEMAQSELNNILTSDTLLTLLLGSKKPVSERAHQTLYLKNRFFKQLGLKHTLTFDPHSRVIQPDLLQVTPQRALHRIFNQLDLKRLVTMTQNHIQELLEKAEKKKEVYNKLYELFERIENKPKDWQNDFLNFNEAFEFQGITQKGALRLLIHARAVKKEA